MRTTVKTVIFLTIAVLCFTLAIFPEGSPDAEKIGLLVGVVTVTFGSAAVLLVARLRNR